MIDDSFNLGKTNKKELKGNPDATQNTGYVQILDALDTFVENSEISTKRQKTTTEPQSSQAKVFTKPLRLRKGYGYQVMRTKKTKSTKKRISEEDFIFLNRIGEGSLAKVYKCEMRSTGGVYAIKKTSKAKYGDFRLI